MRVPSGTYLSLSGGPWVGLAGSPVALPPSSASPDPFFSFSPRAARAGRARFFPCVVDFWLAHQAPNPPTARISAAVPSQTRGRPPPERRRRAAIGRVGGVATGASESVTKPPSASGSLPAGVTEAEPEDMTGAVTGEDSGSVVDTVRVLAGIATGGRAAVAGVTAAVPCFGTEGLTEDLPGRVTGGGTSGVACADSATASAPSSSLPVAS